MASGRYTDIRVDTVPPIMLLKKQMRKSARPDFETEFALDIAKVAVDSIIDYL